jgi:predicted amidohydrolase
MQRCRVAATQLDVRHMNPEQNLETHARLIAETAVAGCQLVVFPELSVTGHNGSQGVLRFAEPSDGRIFSRIHEEARRHGIVVGYGFCEIFRGTHYNAYALVSPDGLVGIQRKVDASFDEFFHFRQAYEWNVFDLDIGRVGTLICHDSDFFESWRILALKGVELVLLPHANRKMFAPDGSLAFDGSDREAPRDQILQYQADQIAERPVCRRIQDTLARDNAVFAAFSDQVGFDGHSTHVGGAYVLAPDGSLMARSEISVDSGWISADLDPELLRRVRENPVFALRKRRPETYGELTILL